MRYTSPILTSEIRSSKFEKKKAADWERPTLASAPLFRPSVICFVTISRRGENPLKELAAHDSLCGMPKGIRSSYSTQAPEEHASSRTLVPFPPFEAHGLIGDRRTAALIAADGTVDWFCLPDYDGDIVFGALLDCLCGGFWKLGPSRKILGDQNYFAEGGVLRTVWALPQARLELNDFMPWPESARNEKRKCTRVIVRRLRVVGGSVECMLDFTPRKNFKGKTKFTRQRGTNLFHCSTGALKSFLWCSRAIHPRGGELQEKFQLSAGQEIWMAFGVGEADGQWSISKARRLLKATRQYWRTWSRKLEYHGAAKSRILRSAQTVHLLTHAPTGSIVAAPTTSMPARIGGDWNFDYRLSWVRDASLSLAVLGLLGNGEDARRYLDWLTTLSSSIAAPLQVVYGIHGKLNLSERTFPKVLGHRESPPVRIGNHAYHQRQLGSFGYLADCALIYLNHQNEWKDSYWQLLRRVADFTARAWKAPGNGIWELPVRQHYVSSKVMSWVTLDRCVKIARMLRNGFNTSHWEKVAANIHADVMRFGWSERRQSFKQRYEGENLDAAVLLIPVTDFLPARHPRVISTVDCIAEHLTIGNFVHRFVPRETPGLADLPMGEFEAAFLPCTFWLATAYAKMGRFKRAEEIIASAESVCGGTGLFAEGVDARIGSFLGNGPLLFSQVEYVRALLAIEKGTKAGGFESSRQVSR